MSQYKQVGIDPTHTVLVGYDPPLKTLFVTVLEERLNEEDEILLELGTSYQEITNIDELRQKSSRYVKLGDYLCEVVVHELEEDRKTPDSPIVSRLRQMGLLESQKTVGS